MDSPNGPREDLQTVDRGVRQVWKQEVADAQDENQEPVGDLDFLGNQRGRCKKCDCKAYRKSKFAISG